MQEFKQAIAQKNEEHLTINQLETIADEFPYFQLSKAILLKKYRRTEHFKYNNTLKNLAAHTCNREILFDYINTLEESQKTLKPSILQKENLTENKASQNTEVDEFKKPLEFTSTERHSFKEWLQLSHQKPIERKNEDGNKPLETKISTIDQFLSLNPKISPPKKGVKTNLAVKKSVEDNSDQLMTETLAKVYITQKKYDDAIQAYKILSLKYPEKSTFFANQIERIEILQKNKS